MKDIKTIAIAVITGALDDLVGACFDDDGKPQTPDRRALMKAKGFLPETYTNSYQKKRNKKETP